MSNPSPRTVYAVSSGEYSDYGVGPIFEDKADAEATVIRMNTNNRWADARVEEFDLYPPGSRHVVKPHMRWTAQVPVHTDGTLGEPTMQFNYVDSDTASPAGVIDVRGINHYVADEIAFLVTADSVDADSAKKAARERAAKVASLLIEGVDPTLRALGLGK